VLNPKLTSVGCCRDRSMAGQHRFAEPKRIAGDLSIYLIVCATFPMRELSKFGSRGKTGRCHGS
jgi:hypothetical protein